MHFKRLSKSVCIALASFILSSIIGVGVALAWAEFDMFVGWGYYEGRHDEPPDWGPWYDWSESHWGWANSNKTQFIVDDTKVYDHGSDEGLQFGPNYFVMDYLMNHRVAYDEFDGDELRFLNKTEDCGWTYSGLGSSNPYVYVTWEIYTATWDAVNDEAVGFDTGY
jgi:hypothetical protein